jgi:hypothetical protein
MNNQDTRIVDILDEDVLGKPQRILDEIEREKVIKELVQQQVHDLSEAVYIAQLSDIKFTKTVLVDKIYTLGRLEPVAFTPANEFIEFSFTVNIADTIES